MNEPLEHRSILDMTHTPTPWRLVENTPTLIEGAADYPALAQTMLVRGDGSLDEARANAELIVTAVNAFEANQARIAELTRVLAALELQALQSNVNHPSNEWGREALADARTALSIPS